MMSDGLVRNNCTSTSYENVLDWTQINFKTKSPKNFRNPLIKFEKKIAEIIPEEIISWFTDTDTIPDENRCRILRWLSVSEIWDPLSPTT